MPWHGRHSPRGRIWSITMVMDLPDEALDDVDYPRESENLDVNIPIPVASRAFGPVVHFEACGQANRQKVIT